MYSVWGFRAPSTFLSFRILIYTHLRPPPATVQINFNFTPVWILIFLRVDYIDPVVILNKYTALLNMSELTLQGDTWVLVLQWMCTGSYSVLGYASAIRSLIRVGVNPTRIHIFKWSEIHSLKRSFSLAEDLEELSWHPSFEDDATSGLGRVGSAAARDSADLTDEKSTYT